MKTCTENAMENVTVTSPYGLDPDHRETLGEKILKELNRDAVLTPLRSKIDAVCQAAIDWTTEYLQEEYSEILEELVRDRAKRLVMELLRGNPKVGQYFRLEKITLQMGLHVSEDVVYDPDGIRHAIMERFRDQIITAEMIALQKENARLEQELKWRREIDRA